MAGILGYNPYRDTEGKFDDGPQLLASRGRPKVSSTEQRKKIDAAKEKLRAQYMVPEDKPERDKVLDGPKYMEVAGFAINEQNLTDNDVRTILWRDRELFPGQTYGEYYATEKNKKGDLFMMTPAEYRQALVESGQYKDVESIERRMDWNKVDQYTEDMQSGDKFPPAGLWYDEQGKTEQEGLHRVYAAERVGIEKVPVTVSSDTRNQDIYPYNKLEGSIVSQDELHARVEDEPTSDNKAIEQVFYGLSSLGGEYGEINARINDPATTPSEVDALTVEKKQLEKDLKAEAKKAVDAIKKGDFDMLFLTDLEKTVVGEQALAYEQENEFYLEQLDKLIAEIFNQQVAKNGVPAKTVNQISARDYADIYKDLDINTDDLGCIMLDLEPMPVKKYVEGKEDELFENPQWDQGSVPAETVPHVTLLYGLLENGNVWKKKVDALLKDWEVKTVTIDHVGFFDTPDSYAVVAHLVKTPEIVDGHERLTLLPHINTFSEYLPHMTLAYVKKDADVDAWVKALNKQYKGKKVKAKGINYGDKPDKKSKNDASGGSLSSIGQDHNAISPSGLIVAQNSLDSDTRDIIKAQENALRDGFRDIERRITEAAAARVARNYLDEPSDLISATERKKFEQEVEALLNTFYINLYPIFGRQLLAQRASEYGVLGTYQMTKEAQAYIEEMAAKAAVSHVGTVIQDLLTAGAIVYGGLVVAAMVTLVVAAVAAGNVEIKKRLPEGATREQIEAAIKRGVFNDMTIYKDAQLMARQGESQATIVRTIQYKYQDISKGRATTIARTESARVFNQSQFEADRQFLNDSGLMSKAYKKLRSRTGTPCVHCKLLIDMPPIPFMQNFADLGTTLSAVETSEDGTVKVKTLPINWESIRAGNVHPNCNCEYVLVINNNGKMAANAIEDALASSESQRSSIDQLKVAMDKKDAETNQLKSEINSLTEKLAEMDKRTKEAKEVKKELDLTKNKLSEAEARITTSEEHAQGVEEYARQLESILDGQG